MTQVSASMVKELREKTGAGLMDCKSALAQAGDMDGAIKILREKGLAKAAKKTSRSACEGLVFIKTQGKKASMVELNCETDFVARNEDFKKLLEELANIALSYNPSSSEDKGQIEGQKLDGFKTSLGNTVAELISEKVATIGEKISLRRFACLDSGDVYGCYLHGDGNIGVVVEAKLNDPSLANKEQVLSAARDVAMHVAAFNPAFIRSSEIAADWLKAEREIFNAQVLSEGKPANMVEKIVDGKMSKHIKEHCLLDQPFVKNPDISVQKMLDEVKASTNAELSITKIVRFKVGEGMEKKEDNFADEVSKMIN